MDSIVLYNQNGQKFNVNVVRYFQKGNNKYLVFDLAEVDANGYIQLYLAKVNNENGRIIMGNVTNEDEWNDFRNTIQKIVTNNRNGIANEGDLDFKELDGAIVSEFRIFKLKEDVARTLGEKKNAGIPVTPIVEDKPMSEPVNLQSASARDTGLTIEEILKQVSDGARNARENSKVTLTPKKTLEDIMRPVEPVVPQAPIAPQEPIAAPVTPVAPAAPVMPEPPVVNELPKVEPQVDFTVPVTHEVFTEEPKFFVPVEDKLEPKVIPSMPRPVVPTDTTDYKAKYDESLRTIRKLEDENIRLINELVEAKAKLATIKDIMD